jgi:hypothetical protein
MTTFTSDDREEEYKKILKETQALEKGLKFFKKLKGDNASPPHIVDSGASVMTKELTDDEIQELIDYVAEKPTNEDLYDFARAILRKAKEK